MPWQVSDPMSQRVQFVAEVADGVFSMTELCHRYGISRKTGYKWCDRGGELRDRSRRPRKPRTTAPGTMARIIALRRQYGWGPRKLRRLLLTAGVEPVPARATIALILKREGLIARRARRPPRQAAPAAHTAMAAPNVVWTADFKGEFRTGDGAWCYPLTVVDGFSRYLLTCTGLARPRTTPTRRVFERVFRTYGLPHVVRTDNGEPFASAITIGRLFATERLVDSAGDSRGTHCARSARPKRPPRALPPHPLGGHAAPAGRSRRHGAATAVPGLSSTLQ